MIIAFCVQSIIVMGIMITSFYFFIKSIQYNVAKRHKIIIVGWCLLLSFLYAYTAGTSLVPLTLIRPFLCGASVVFVFMIIRQKLEIVVSAYLMSFGISLCLYYIAGLIVGSVSMFLLSRETIVDAPINYNQPIYLLIHILIFTLQLILAILLFRIRSFKKGFPFIFNKFAIVVALTFTGIILILVTWVNMISVSEESIYVSRYLYIAGVLVAGAGIYILIRRLIKNYQRMRVQQNTERYYEKLYYEEKTKNEELLKLNRAKSSVIHNFTDRLKAMEEAVACGTTTPDDIQNLQKDWHNELDKIKSKKHLPPTNLQAIDNLFEYFAKQFTAENIEFNVMVNGSIKYMVDNVIEQGKLETLIVNHLKDAQIAVNSSENPFRHITVIIGLSKEYYEFTVLDSGIEFEVDTLVRLGTGRVTTHADTGGIGIGFESTFEILQECKASLVINEHEQSNIDYSKSVSIRFDDKNQYIVETYRPYDFPVSGRYIVVSSKHSLNYNF